MSDSSNGGCGCADIVICIFIIIFIGGCFGGGCKGGCKAVVKPFHEAWTTLDSGG